MPPDSMLYSPDESPMSSTVPYLNATTLSIVLHLFGILVLALLLNRFLRALTNKPGAPASGHRCICGATTLALNDVAICVFVFYDEQLRVNCVDESFREVRNLLRARAATILQLVVGKKCQPLLVKALRFVLNPTNLSFTLH